MRFLTVFSLIAGLCASAGDAWAQGSAETDRAALEAVYRATGGDDWTDNTNWLTDAPLKDWYGVEANGQGRVTGLRLGAYDESQQENVGNGLTGRLPPELGALGHLRRLQVEGNPLTGPIPAELGNLLELRELYLGGNALTGPIPAELGNLTSLHGLNLGGNVLTGTLPATLANLTDLEWLSVWGETWTPEPAPEWLGALTNLRAVDLGGHRFTGPIPASWRNLGNLNDLYLWGNALTGSIPPWLGTLTSLRNLDLNSNALTGPIPPELGNLGNLTELGLEFTVLTGPMPASLSRLSSLARFSIEGTGVCVPDDAALQAWLAAMPDFTSSGLDCGETPAPVTVAFERTTHTAPEGGSAYVKLRLSETPAPARAVTVAVTATPGGGATAADYRVPGTVTFWPDATETGIYVMALQDGDADDGETVTLGFGALPTGISAGTPAAATVTIEDLPAYASTFSRVITQPGLGRFDSVLAVADLDDDGRDDILAGGWWDSYSGATPEERFAKRRMLRVFVSTGDGSFRHAPELVEGTIDVRTPIVATDDFNGDGRADFAVFDGGTFVREHLLGYGNPPQLFLSSPDGRLRPSDALADAVRREHELRPNPDYSGPADLHVKLATSGDIDGDGDIDLWVESTGGANVNSHFMVNNGDGTFTLDDARAPDALLHNPPPEYWRHVGADLVDLDNDGDLDLALGQLRHFDPLQINGFSIVLVNDGTGHYPERIELPHPAFYDGYTSVQALTHFDVNGDGFQDLLLVHDRMDNTLPNVIYFTGRYVQVLINRHGGTSFGDETLTWMGDQGATTPERDQEGNPLHSRADPKMHDVDRDGCADLVMSRSNGGVRTESPLVYRNDGSGRFRPMSPVPFAGSDRYFGYGAVPADVNGDAAIDFVVPQHNSGPDERYDTADDFTTLVTLLNTTPAGPVRCRPRVTTVRLLQARTLYVGAGAVAVVVPVGDAFRNASTYRASSSVPGVATVSLSGSNLTVTPVAAGMATITVTASGVDNSVVTQRFRVTVMAATAFTDHLRPGLTLVKATHFLELRTRVAALRMREGLPPVRWTDPVLTVGVTPVKRVHLTELRNALDGAYDAAGRSRPTYTDGTETAGVTAIKAVHVMELRNAIVALE